MILLKKTSQRGLLCFKISTLIVLSSRILACIAVAVACKIFPTKHKRWWENKRLRNLWIPLLHSCGACACVRVHVRCVCTRCAHFLRNYLEFLTITTKFALQPLSKWFYIYFLRQKMCTFESSLKSNKLRTFQWIKIQSSRHLLPPFCRSTNRNVAHRFRFFRYR